MKILLITWLLASIALGQDLSGLDMIEVAKTLRLEGTKLKIENVTQREANTRKLPLKSAWIVSAPGHDLFYPLIVYTAEKGVLKGEKYEKFRKWIKEKPPKPGDFGYELGFFEVAGIGECLVLLEEFRISSNRPPTAKGVVAPWKPNRTDGLSIIGSLESENLDFQIGFLIPREEELTDFPEYQKMIYGAKDPKVIGAALVGLVRDSQLLTAAEVSPQKPSNEAEGISEMRETAESVSAIYGSDTKTNTNKNAFNKVEVIWPCILILLFLIVVFIFSRKWKGRHEQ